MKLADLKETRYAGGAPDLIDTVQQIIRDAGYKLGTGVRDTVAIGMNTPVGIRNAKEIVLRTRNPDKELVGIVTDGLKRRGLKVIDVYVRATINDPIHAEITVHDPSF